MSPLRMKKSISIVCCALSVPLSVTVFNFKHPILKLFIIIIKSYLYLTIIPTVFLLGWLLRTPSTGGCSLNSCKSSQLSLSEGEILFQQKLKSNKTEQRKRAVVKFKVIIRCIFLPSAKNAEIVFPLVSRSIQSGLN